MVDGQQRLTTLTLLLHALIAKVADVKLQTTYRIIFIESPLFSEPTFQVLGENKAFFSELLNGQNPVPQSPGQKRLQAAYLWIGQRVQALENAGGQACIKSWLECIKDLEVLEFVEPDEGKAIRMFQSVNDRGVPLSRMDILKSLLVYYSNRYLNGALDLYISKQFGDAFHSFSRIKELATEAGYQVNLINRESFKEDDVLRYHYLAFDGSPYGSESGADYTATSETVLETYLKPTLQKLRGQPEQLKEFIENYTNDLTQFFAGLESLLEAARTDRDLYLLFVMQNLSATLYPLVIRLERTQLLHQAAPNCDRRSLLKLIEAVDLRVFKIRGTNPQADIFWLTRKLPKLTLDEVVLELHRFIDRFMTDGLLTSRVIEEALYRNDGLNRILLEEEDQARESMARPLLDINGLTALLINGMTVEHILPQQPNFNIEAYGFSGKEEYEQYKHRIGNLLLLEGPINSACSNHTVEEKMRAPNMYPRSSLLAVSALAARHAGNAVGFDRAAVDTRAQELARMVVQRWPIKVA